MRMSIIPKEDDAERPDSSGSQQQTQQMDADSPASLAPGPPRRPMAALDAGGNVQLSWEPPLSSGSNPIVTYTVFGRRGGESGSVEVVACIAVGADEPAGSPSAMVAPKPGGWWEFSVCATNVVADGPHSPPSLPLLVLPARTCAEQGGAAAARAAAAAEAEVASMPVSPVGPSLAGLPSSPVLDLSGVLGTAFTTLGKLFAGSGGSGGSRRNSFIGPGFLGLPEPSAPERATFVIASEHEAACRLGGSSPVPLEPSVLLDALLEAAADSSSFPLRARTRHLFEWPVRGQRFKHGQHDVEMTLDSLFRLVRHSLQSAGQREDDAGADVRSSLPPPTSPARAAHKRAHARRPHASRPPSQPPDARQSLCLSLVRVRRCASHAMHASP